MASNVGDKLLWTAIIVSSIAACWYIPHILYEVKESAVVSIAQPKPSKPQLEKDAEAAIHPSTLADLAEGPSYHLTASAIKLTASKFFKSDAKQLLLKDIASKDPIRRDKAIDGLSLLLTNTALKENSVRSHFTDATTFNYLVTALVDLLPEHEKAPRSTLPPPSPVRPTNRPVHESAILSFIVLLLNEPRKIGNNSRSFYIIDTQPLIDAGIITRWLKHYPFPCTLPENRRWNFKRHDVVHLLRKEEWGDDDEQMSTLIGMLMKVPTGARQLADIGLRSTCVHDSINTRPLDLRSTHSSDWETRQFTVRVTNDEPEDYEPGTFGHFMNSGEGDLIDDEEMIVRLQQQADESSNVRLRDGRTAGEQSLRRRHRQAIVVAEAGMPLREENILQRQPTETELSWQEEMASRDHVALERIDGMEGGNVGGVREGPVPPSIDLQDMDLELEWLSEP